MENLEYKMKKFELMINTADKTLAEELISPTAFFLTPASTKPLYGPQGYLSVVKWMRSGFSDVVVRADFGAAAPDEQTTRWFFSCRK